MGALHGQEGRVGGLEGLLWSPASSLALEDQEGQTPERGFAHIDLQLNIVDLFFKSPGPPKKLPLRQSHTINPCNLTWSVSHL